MNDGHRAGLGDDGLAVLSQWMRGELGVSMEEFRSAYAAGLEPGQPEAAILPALLRQFINELTGVPTADKTLEGADLEALWASGEQGKAAVKAGYEKARQLGWTTDMADIGAIVYAAYLAAGWD